MEPTFSSHPESSSNDALSQLLGEYGQQLPDDDTVWQAIQANLTADSTAQHTIHPTELAQQAALWADTPYALDSATRTAFEQQLSQDTTLQHHVAQLTELHHTLAGYAQRAGDTLATTLALTPQQLVQQSFSADAPATTTPLPTPMVEILPMPRWASAIAASLLLVATLGITPVEPSVIGATLAQATPAAYTEASPNLLLATGAPPVEQYVLESCTDTVPTSDWGVLSRCQF